MADFTLTTEAGNRYDISLGVEKSDKTGFSMLNFALRQRFRPSIRLSGYVRCEDVADFAAELKDFGNKKYEEKEAVNDNGVKNETS